MILISCRNCQKIYSKKNHLSFKCERCGHKVTKRIENSLQVSLALVITAILLFIPAMLYPMMDVTQFGVVTQSTIFEGVISFFNYGDYFIAIVILTASIIIPVVKLLGLLFIFLSLSVNVHLSNKTKLSIFHFIEFIGKWSMIDIYVVALLAATVQLNQIFNIKGGIATSSFALVVVLTIIAARRFDTRIIWDE